jgi:hypothetical protein
VFSVLSLLTLLDPTGARQIPAHSFFRAIKTETGGVIL